MKRLPIFPLLILCSYINAGYAAESCIVDSSRVNDNYCDCPKSGEDETKTSACAPAGRFHCVDRPDKVSFPSSRVDDGVCDCCDGSDEPPGTCRNVCEELDRLERERFEQTRLLREQGEKKFLELVENAKIPCKTPAEVEHEKEEKRANEEALRIAQEKLSNLEAGEETKTITQRIESLYLNSLSREELEKLIIKLASESKSGVTLERLVADILPCARSEEGEGDEDREPCDPVWVDHAESEELRETKSIVEDLQEKVGSEGDEDDESENPKDYGPGNAWRALKKECFTLKKEKYNYEVCLFQEFRQDHVSLGKWKTWSHPHDEMLFDGGDMCYSPAVPRSIKVKVECGETSALLDISEPSTCVYEAHFKSPAACVPEGFQVDSSTACSAT